MRGLGFGPACRASETSGGGWLLRKNTYKAHDGHRACWLVAGSWLDQCAVATKDALELVVFQDLVDLDRLGCPLKLDIGTLGVPLQPKAMVNLCLKYRSVGSYLSTNIFNFNFNFLSSEVVEPAPVATEDEASAGSSCAALAVRAFFVALPPSGSAFVPAKG
jgi:hypothetical protein